MLEVNETRPSKRDKKIRSNCLVSLGSSVEELNSLIKNGSRRSPSRTLQLREDSPERFAGLEFLFLLFQDKRKEKVKWNQNRQNIRNS